MYECLFIYYQVSQITYIFVYLLWRHSIKIEFEFECDMGHGTWHVFKELNVYIFRVIYAYLLSLCLTC